MLLRTLEFPYSKCACCRQQGHVGSKTFHQQNPAVLYWRCQLTQVDLYNSPKMVVVVVCLLLISRIFPVCLNITRSGKGANVVCTFFLSCTVIHALILYAVYWVFHTDVGFLLLYSVGQILQLPYVKSMIADFVTNNLMVKSVIGSSSPRCKPL